MWTGANFDSWVWGAVSCRMAAEPARECPVRSSWRRLMVVSGLGQRPAKSTIGNEMDLATHRDARSRSLAYGFIPSFLGRDSSATANERMSIRLVNRSRTLKLTPRLRTLSLRGRIIVSAGDDSK